VQSASKWITTASFDIHQLLWRIDPFLGKESTLNNRGTVVFSVILALTVDEQRHGNNVSAATVELQQ
jgi:hypothetical protein